MLSAVSSLQTRRMAVCFGRTLPIESTRRTVPSHKGRRNLLLCCAALFCAACRVHFTAFASMGPLARRPRWKNSFSDPLTHARGRQASLGCAAEGGGGDTMPLRSPLRWIGSYPTLRLWFPDLSTAEQKQSGDKGVSLTFVLDTGASVNTIRSQVAADLGLARVGTAPAGVGAGGNFSGGDTFLLGDCELADLPAANRAKFMTGLTASALPVATPAAAGILGYPFLTSFPGGVDFRWGGTGRRVISGSSDESSEASITFLGGEGGMEAVSAGLCTVPMRQLPDTRLPCATLTVNGVGIPALLDTGSPITVLNAAAAAAAGLDVSGGGSDRDSGGSSDSDNPFANLFAGVGAALDAAREAATFGQRVASGDLVLIAGADGMIQLSRSKVAVSFSLGEAEIDNSTVLVGEVPGLAALDGLGAAAGPAALLGVDVLRQRPRLVIRANEMFV
ncbi:unnamed protein product [Prorocentrum cordatum]|uniref:Peptidase A2 domain-containing protein n=1 Tax=Prorocentrum cordatum TaxID=2364126 RepID=A0ABN9RUX9_9DINO|nr:unnamed protein product [Polarella glacialis]